MRAGQVLHPLQRIAQRGAEGRRTGRGLLQRLGRSRCEQQTGIPGMAAEGRHRALAVGGLVLGDVVLGALLDRVVGGQLGRHQHRAGRQQRAFDILAADAQEVVVGNAVGLVDLAGIAALLQRLLRQGRGRAGTGDQDGVGLGRDKLEHLAGDRRVRAVVAFAGDDVELLGRGDLVELAPPALAVGIGKADEAGRLDAVVDHVGHDGQGHHDVVLRRLEHPALLRVDGLDDAGRGRHRDHRRAGLGHRIDHRQRVGRGGRADDDVDLVVGDQLARIGDGRGGVGGVIQDDVVDLLATQGLRHQREGVLLGDAQRRGRAGGRQRDADIDIGLGGQGQRCGERRGELLEPDHGVSPRGLLSGHQGGLTQLHRAEAAKEQIADQGRQRLVRELAVGPQPGEGPVDHAKEQHGQGLVQPRILQLRPQLAERRRELGHDAALHVQQALALGIGEEADLAGQHAVLVLGVGVGAGEALDQRAQLGIRRQPLCLDLVHQRQQRMHMAVADLREQILLVLEVVVKRRLGHAAGLGDLVHRRGTEALFCEEPGGRGEDVLALGFKTGGAFAGHALSARRS
mmetsp:Transcript_6985/g.29651  ORF Transcript_6985/g.29651 Transcript_6985/m.29651 type:complete len:571 (-) Transcript_6985:511-2223(-)